MDSRDPTREGAPAEGHAGAETPPGLLPDELGAVSVERSRFLMHGKKLKFQYLAEHDVLVVTVDWALETKEDVEHWEEAYASYFRTHFKRKVDVILELTKFRIHPRVAGSFGKVRAKILREYTARSYRVNADSVVKTAMYTSHVLHNAPANEFRTIEAAIRQIAVDRAQNR